MANQGFVTGNLQMFAPHNHEAPVLTQYGAEVKFTEAGFCNKHNDVQLRQKKKDLEDGPSSSRSAIAVLRNGTNRSINAIAEWTLLLRPLPPPPLHPTHHYPHRHSIPPL